jgi:hypothetical protein
MLRFLQPHGMMHIEAQLCAGGQWGSPHTSSASRGALLIIIIIIIIISSSSSSSSSCSRWPYTICCGSSSSLQHRLFKRTEALSACCCTSCWQVFAHITTHPDWSDTEIAYVSRTEYPEWWEVPAAVPPAACKFIICCATGL